MQGETSLQEAKKKGKVVGEKWKIMQSRVPLSGPRGPSYTRRHCEIGGCRDTVQTNPKNSASPQVYTTVESSTLVVSSPPGADDPHSQEDPSTAGSVEALYCAIPGGRASWWRWRTLSPSILCPLQSPEARL